MKSKIESYGPWQLGINNSVRDYRLPEGSCLDALNLDVANDGSVSRRKGFGAAQGVTFGHSLITLGGHTIIVRNGVLGRVTNDSPLTVSDLRSGIGHSRVSYAERGGEIWWSNGTYSGRVNLDGTNSPWSVPAPQNIPLISSTTGTMPSGSYRLAITHLDSNGEEGPASEIAVYALAAPGALVVTLPAAQAGTAYFNIYCSIANGSLIQKYSTVIAATASVTISAPPTGRDLGRLAHLSALPAGTAICFHNDRLLSLSGEFLYYSEPHLYGLYRPDENYLVLGSSGSIMASVESGVFVAADSTWFYSGEDIANSVPDLRLPYGAVAGTEFFMPGATAHVVGWYGQDGIVIGSPDGSVNLTQKERGFIPPVAASGISWVRDRNGVTHVITMFDSTAAYPSGRVSEDFSAALSRRSTSARTLCFNPENGATSRYSGWAFNSFAEIGGVSYGIDSDGLHDLSGDDDNGEDIVAVLALGRIGTTSWQIKYPDVAYLSGTASSAPVLNIMLPSGAEYAYQARSAKLSPGVMRVEGMRGLINERAAWFLTDLCNQSGASIEISALQILMHESNRRI